jgi:hypothetical protein
MHGCLDGDLRVGDRDAVELPRVRALTVAEARVESDADAGRGIRPLRLQVLGGRDDDEALDDAAAQQFGRETQGEGRLAGAGVAAARKSRGPRPAPSGPSAPK